METPSMTNKPEIIQYGGGKDTKLTIQFSQELAILLVVVESLNQPVPAIIPGWSVKIRHVNIVKNNLMMLWIYGNFVATTMIGTTRGQILKLVPILDSTKYILH